MNKRLFFALDILPSDKILIANWRDLKLDLPFKAVAIDNFHITLAFLGHVTVQQQTQLTNKADEIAQHIIPIFTACSKKDKILLIEQIGLFKKPKVLYLGFKVCPNWLNQLAESLVEEAKLIGLFQEDRSYLPHLSIYRKANDITKGLQLNIPIEIKSFSLYHSSSTEHGVSYCPIKTWQLYL